MATKLTGTGIQYGNVPYDQYSTGATTKIQTDANVIVQMKFGSGSTVNQYTGTPNGTSGIVNGSEVDMGVPQKATNWYRLFWQTVTDDTDGSISGIGIRVERWTPSSGWETKLAQGSHASYDNNYSDWYRQNQGIFWVPTHPSYQTQEHRFRIYHANWSGPCRVNSGIGRQTRNGNWENNIFEVWEIDHNVMNSGNLGRY